MISEVAKPVQRSKVMTSDAVKHSQLAALLKIRNTPIKDGRDHF